MKEDVAVALVEFVGVEEEADVSVMLAEAKMEKLASRVGEGSFSIAVCIRLPVRSCTKAALLTNRDGTLQKKKKGYVRLLGVFYIFPDNVSDNLSFDLDP